MGPLDFSFKEEVEPDEACTWSTAVVTAVESSITFSELEFEREYEIYGLKTVALTARQVPRLLPPYPASPAMAVQKAQLVAASVGARAVAPS